MALSLEETLTIETVFVPGYEKVLKIIDKSKGLHAYIAIHSTTMGPALGGTRIFPYHTAEEALTDVLRLAKGMTYKSLLADCGWGGGKSVIMADPKKLTEEMLLAFGQAVNQLKGAYICAEDVGATDKEILMISKATPYVVGLVNEKSSGDPSPFTALGTFRGIQSVLKKTTGSDSVHQRTIAVQGLGNVGMKLAEMLFWNGAKLIVSDIDQNKVARVVKAFDAKAVSIDEILYVPCDVLAPCAMGGILNPQSIAKLNCTAVAGSANNQLLRDEDADLLHKRKILYAPDFIINAGGLINVTQETMVAGYQPSAAREKIHNLYDQLMRVYDVSEQHQYSTNKAALALADYRLQYGIGKRTAPIYLHHANVVYSH